MSQAARRGATLSPGGFRATRARLPPLRLARRTPPAADARQPGRGSLPELPGAGRPDVVSAVDEQSPLSVQPLRLVGVPPYDIVRIDGDSDSGFFLLAADRAGLASGWDLH
jgi:hypothetical protein